LGIGTSLGLLAFLQGFFFFPELFHFAEVGELRFGVEIRILESFLDKLLSLHSIQLGQE